jgi:hypothetical protein
MHPKAFSSDFQGNSRVFWSFLLLVAVGLSAPTWAVTEEELQGDYELTELDINYGVGVVFPPPIDEGDFSPLTGYFSATARTLVFEHIGQASSTFTVYLQRTAGAYELSGAVATVPRLIGDPLTIGLQMPSSDTLIVTGSAFDSNDQAYDYTYKFSRLETYYTQAQLDDAVEEATADCFTQEEVDEAIEEALKNCKPKAVVIPLFD